MARWKRVSGTAYINRNGKLLKVEPGEEIHAEDHELGKRRIGWKLIGPPDPEPNMTAVRIESRGGGGWYDVVNGRTGEPINDKPLRRDAARELARKIVGADVMEDGDDDGNAAQSDRQGSAEPSPSRDSEPPREDVGVANPGDMGARDDLLHPGGRSEPVAEHA